ncbi:MAG: hypothetical protein JO100_02605 [Pseudonocardia sp.]|nr:hypothetical protein [Pseudonocardia sp.]
MVELIDISNVIARLVSDEARYLTGVMPVMPPVDAGFAVKAPRGSVAGCGSV